MKFLILSTLLVVSVRAQAVPDATAEATKTLAPVIGQVDSKAQVTGELLHNIQHAVNPNTTGQLTDLASTGLTSSLGGHFDAVALITDSAANAPEAIGCAVKASSAMLGSVASGATDTVKCLLNKVLAVPHLLEQVSGVVKQLGLHTVTHVLSTITSCVTKSLLTLNVSGALACAHTVIGSALAAVTDLLSTIVAVLGHAINLVLSLVTCAVATLATVFAVAGAALASAVKCLHKIALIEFILPPLHTVIPDVHGVIQAAIKLIFELDALIAQIQALVVSLTSDVKALLHKISGLTAEVIEKTLKNAVSGLLGVINNGHSLHLTGEALTCLKVAQQSVTALIHNGVQTVLSCVGSIGHIGHKILAEVTGYATEAVSHGVSVGVPLIVKCATGALSLSLSAVQSCTNNVVHHMTHFVTTTLQRLKVLVGEVKHLVAAVDKCLGDATDVLVQAVKAVVHTYTSCLGGLGIHV